MNICSLKGSKWLVDEIHGMGLQASFGANYCYAAVDTSPDPLVHLICSSTPLLKFTIFQ